MATEVREHASNRAPRLVDDPRRAEVAFVDELDESSDGDLRAEHRAVRGDEPLGRCDRLEAAAVAAAAERACRLDRHVPDLAREAGRATLELTSDDEASADAGAQDDVDEVLDPASGAERLLRPGAEVGVVLDLDRERQAPFELRRRTHAGPARKDRRRADGPGRPVDRARQ